LGSKRNHVSLHIVEANGRQTHFEVYDDGTVAEQLTTTWDRAAGAFECELAEHELDLAEDGLAVGEAGARVCVGCGEPEHLIVHVTEQGEPLCLCCVMIEHGIEHGTEPVEPTPVSTDFNFESTLDDLLREAGLEYPLGLAGVRDLIRQRDGYLEALTTPATMPAGPVANAVDDFIDDTVRRNNDRSEPVEDV
jgi:hypothetical protein